MHSIITLIIILITARATDSIICYQCTECPEPFKTNYPYVLTVNNTNFLAQCTKTIMHLGDGRLIISKGTVFSCPQQSSSPDVAIYCCGHDYCNSAPQQLSIRFSLFFATVFAFKVFF